jgi:hypothetical protein
LINFSSLPDQISSVDGLSSKTRAFLSAWLQTACVRVWKINCWKSLKRKVNQYILLHFARQDTFCNHVHRVCHVTRKYMKHVRNLRKSPSKMLCKGIISLLVNLKVNLKSFPQLNVTYGVHAQMKTNFQTELVFVVIFFYRK